METATRSLTLNEMYFKKATKPNLPAVSNLSSINKNFLESAALLPDMAHQPKTPVIDLSSQVFTEPSLMEKAGKFINKNWGWLLLGAGILTICIVHHKQNKEKKRQSQTPSA